MSLFLLEIKNNEIFYSVKMAIPKCKHWKPIYWYGQYYYLEDFGILAWMSVGILLSYYHYHQQELKLDYRLEGFGK